MKGGLILTEPELTGFTPVLHMIKNCEELSLTSIESLSGIIFILKVKPENSKYTNFKSVNNAQPITNFIIKMAVITDDQNRYMLGGIPKSTEQKENFFQEAQLQQQIWMNCIQGGKREFVPGVANFALFDNNNSKNMLDCMFNKLTQDRDKRIIMELKGLFSHVPSCNIGIITMDLVDTPLSLRMFEHTYAGTPELTNAYINAIVNILRLFLFYSIIDWDLHGGNILVNIKDQTSYLIDFGRVSNINDSSADSYLNKKEKIDVNKNKQKYYTEFDKYMSQIGIDRASKYTGKTVEQLKFELIFSMCNYISQMEKFVTQRRHSQALLKGIYQMQWIENIINPHNPNLFEICVQIFDLLLANYLDIKIQTSQATIDRYIKTGKIFDLSKSFDDYYYIFSRGANCRVPAAFGAPAAAFGAPADTPQSYQPTIEDSPMEIGDNSNYTPQSYQPTIEDSPMEIGGKRRKKIRKTRRYKKFKKPKRHKKSRKY